MKLKGLLLLLLLLAILLPVTTMFSSASVLGPPSLGIGSSVVVIAKESYVYVRVELVVQPLVNNTNLVVHGGTLVPPTLTFPNGTTVVVTEPTTFTIILPNSVLIGFAGEAEGPGYDVTYSQPVSLQILSNQNATSAPLSSGLPGLEIFQYTLTGDYEVSVSALGVSV